MDEKLYQNSVADTLEQLARRLDDIDHDDLDFSLTDGKLFIEIDNGSPIIVNRQSAAQQIWLAEPSGGWHFNLKDQQWLCDKRSITLQLAISQALQSQLKDPSIQL